MSTIPDTTVQLKDGSTITIRTARPEDVRAVLEHARRFSYDGRAGGAVASDEL